MEKLPHDLLPLIFCSFSGKDLISIMLVSKKWNELAQSDVVWKAQYERFKKTVVAPFLYERILDDFTPSRSWRLQMKQMLQFAWDETTKHERIFLSDHNRVATNNTGLWGSARTTVGIKGCNMIYAEVQLLLSGSLKVGVADTKFDLLYRHSVGHYAGCVNYGIGGDGSVFSKNMLQNVKLHDIPPNKSLGLLLERVGDGMIKFSVFVSRTYQTSFLIKEEEIVDDLFIVCSIGTSGAAVKIVSAIVK